VADELTVIYAARTATDAHQLKNLLVESGISATVTNALLEGGAGVDVLGWPTLARVAVAREDAEAARRMALEFDRRIAAESHTPNDETAAVEIPSIVPESWPLCPECGVRRMTRCPICGTAGTDFVQADPDFFGLPVVDKDATPLSCGCGSGGCSSSRSTSDTDRPANEPCEEPAPEPSHPEGDLPLMLLCPTCADPFVPEYALRCPSCGHEQTDGYETEPEGREPISPRAIAAILVLLALAIGFVVYFARLF